jgi:hypothetical protein
MFELIDSILEAIRPYTKFLFLALLPIVLHWYLSVLRNRWTGLLVPGLFFVAVVVSSLRSLFLGGDPLWVLGIFCLLNIPTALLLLIYALGRKRVEKRERMNAEAGEIEGAKAEEAETE